jgi:hypothetical protein
MKLYRAILFAAILSVLPFSSFSQQFIFFRFTDGTSGIYPLQQVKKLGFEGNGFKLQLSDGTEYAWQLSAIDHYKYTDIITSADEASPAADPWQVAVFPNPSDGKQYLRFRLPAAGNAEVKVHDLAGKLIFRQNLDKLSAGQQEISLNWPAVKPGSYRMQLKSKQFSVSKPIIRN